MQVTTIGLDPESRRSRRQRCSRPPPCALLPWRQDRRATCGADPVRAMALWWQIPGPTHSLQLGASEVFEGQGSRNHIFLRDLLDEAGRGSRPEGASGRPLAMTGRAHELPRSHHLVRLSAVARSSIARLPGTKAQPCLGGLSKVRCVRKTSPSKLIPSIKISFSRNWLIPFTINQNIRFLTWRGTLCRSLTQTGNPIVRPPGTHTGL